jgi:chemotaxis protein methyltransferase CheR
MMAELELDAIERFRRAIARRFGLALQETPAADLDRLLRARAARRGEDVATYVRALEFGGAAREMRELASILTVPETYFFRYADQYRAVFETVVPDLCRARGPGAVLRVLSAGCASGEEPYSLSIALRERSDVDCKLAITAIELNPVALRRARLGRYSSWSLRETPAAIKERYFRRDGDEFVLDGSVRESVTFEERNILADDPRFWAPGAFDLVLFRNVLMYFIPEAARAVVAKIAGSMAPGASLFLGDAETLRDLSQDFHLRSEHGAFFYVRRDDLSPAGAPEPRAPAPERVAARTPSPEPATGTPSQRPTGAPAAARAITTAALTVPLDFLRQERFGAALAAFAALPERVQATASARVLRAVLLSHTGDLAGAEETCRHVLDDDDLNAGAHYLLALCREQCGDPAGAMRHHRLAMHLDPFFAMPYLHAGLLSRRRGELDDARRDLRRAAELFEREDPLLILLFGGGFGAGALVRLARAELAACGAPS